MKLYGLHRTVQELWRTGCVCMSTLRKVSLCFLTNNAGLWLHICTSSLLRDCRLAPTLQTVRREHKVDLICHFSTMHTDRRPAVGYTRSTTWTCRHHSTVYTVLRAEVLRSPLDAVITVAEDIDRRTKRCVQCMAASFSVCRLIGASNVCGQSLPIRPSGRPSVCFFVSIRVFYYFVTTNYLREHRRHFRELSIHLTNITCRRKLEQHNDEPHIQQNEYQSHLQQEAKLSLG